MQRVGEKQDMTKSLKEVNDQRIWVFPYLHFRDFWHFANKMYKYVHNYAKGLRMIYHILIARDKPTAA